jgi:hypothetical protein
MKINTLLTTAIFCLIGLIAQAAVIYVDKDATGSNNGSSWANAYTQLQDGLSAATSSDEVWVADGIYKPTTTTNRSVAFEITVALELYGGFNGTETNRSQRNWDTNLCRLSGQIGDVNDNTDNSYHVVIGSAAGLLIDGFILENAYRDFSEVGFTGGALYVNAAADVTVEHCIFRNNTSYNGAAVLVLNGGLVMEDCLVRDNHVKTSSVVVLQGGSTAYITQCTFSQNDFDIDVGSVVGGFITSSVEIYNSICWDNDGFGLGGSTVDIVDHCVLDVYSEFGDDSFTNIIQSDPLFNNPVSNSFWLSPGSPAIGAGINGYSTNYYDLNHEARIWNGTLDIGCFESLYDRVIYVDDDATGNDNGSSWEHAFSDLQLALAEAQAEDEIWVAAGLYKPSYTGDRTASFIPLHQVPMYGGFVGDETNFDDRNWIDNKSILSGNIGGQFNAIDNSYHVVKVIDELADIVLDGFTIQKGRADGLFQDERGGGIYIEDAQSALIANCWIFDNYAVEGGGAWLWELDGGATVTNSLVQGNDAQLGAGIYYIGTTTIENGFFLNNIAENGILYAETLTDLDLIGCTFYGNIVDQVAGSHLISGLNSGFMMGEVVNSIFWGNTFLMTNAVLLNSTFIEVRNSILEGAALQTINTGEEVYFEDPLFIDPVIGDFQLCPGSIGFGGGDNSVVTTDIDLLLGERIVGDDVDMGALEGGDEVVVVFVDKDATGSDDGTSWTDAYDDLKTALTSCPCNAEIWVAEGEYFPTATTNRAQRFEIPTGVNLYGGFIGTEANRPNRDWEANPTILSGAIGGGGDVDNSKFIVGVADAGKGTLIDGFKFRHAYADFATEFGSALLSSAGELKVRHCEFSQNTAHFSPAINVSTGLCTIDNCLFFDNANEVGGTVAGGSMMADIIVRHCTFSQNLHVSPLGLEVNVYADALLDAANSIFWDNEGLNFYNNPFWTITNCIVQDWAGGGTDVLNLDPLFIDPANNNFELQITSPAVNTGNNSFSNLNQDLKHEDRQFASTVDMGCFEFRTTDIIYVDKDAAGADDGTSWEDAYTDLQHALTLFSGTEEIWVAEGSYKPGNSRSSAFDLPLNVKMYGGYSGDEVLLSQRNWVVNETRLSGNIGVQGDATDNCYHVVTIASAGQVTLDGFVIGAGYADGIGLESTGSGLSVSSTTLDLNNCRVEANYASTAGAGLRISGGSNVNVSGCVFVDNEAVSSTAIYILTGSTVDISDTQIKDNTANSTSAGISCYGDLTLTNVQFLNNHALVPAGTIGALLVVDGYLEAYDCLFDGNSAASTMGAAYVSGTTSGGFYRCTFSNNSASSVIGALQLASSFMYIENCLFHNNSGSDSGAMLIAAGSTAQITNCTFTENTATGGNSCVALTGNGGWFANNCVWNNDAGVAVQVGPNNAEPSHCIIEGGSVGVNILDVDPQFIDPALKDFHITSNSPAFDAGDDSYIGLGGDLDNNTRLMFDAVDIGCYEVATLYCPGDFNGDGLRNTTDLLAFLGEFGCTVDCTYDLDGDGLVNTADLLAFLGVFGIDCP